MNAKVLMGLLAFLFMSNLLPMEQGPKPPDEDPTLSAGGGEYPSQDGFGWTNGVLLKLMKVYGIVE